MKYFLLELGGGITNIYYNPADGTHTFSRNGESVSGYQFKAIREKLRQSTHDVLGLDYDNDHREIYLSVVYGIDVPDAVRKEMSACLSKEALGSVVEIASEKIIKSHLCAEKRIEEDVKKAILFLYSDNRDLYVRLTDLPEGNLLGHLVLSGEGQDPRIESAAEYIYNKVSEYTECSYEEAAPSIRKAIIEFIASGRNELGTIHLPDCRRNPYLDRKKMEDFNPSKGADFSSRLLELLKVQKIEAHDCAVVFQGFAANNSYFSHAMDKFTPLVDIDPNLGDDIRNRILRSMEGIIQEEPDEGGQPSDEPVPEEDPVDDIKDDHDNDITKNPSYRQFVISPEVKITSKYFIRRRRDLYVEVAVKDSLELPCRCALTIDDHNYKTFKEETVFDEVEKGKKGPFLFGPYPFPLKGIDPRADKIYIHFYPSEKGFPWNLFRDNHKEIKL